MKKGKIKSTIVFSMALLGLGACTKLEPKVYSKLLAGDLYSDTATLNNAQDLVNIRLIEYGNGEQTRLGNAASGELVDPLNGFGNAEQYTKAAYLHQFNPTHNTYNQMWETFYSGISLANLTIYEVENLPNKPANIAKILAEVRVSRAFFLYNAMDAFGNIPLDTAYKKAPGSVKTNTRLEAFNYIEKELKQNIPLLGDNATNKTRMNKYLGYTILAQLYINAQVYTGTPRWADAVAACDMVINSGKYRLSNNYFDNFAAIQSTDENMLVATKETVPGLGGNTFVIESVHEKGGPAIGIKGEPWGRFVSTAENYNIYQSEDIRRRQFLVGRQYAALPGQRIIDGAINTGAALKSTTSGNLIYNLNINKVVRWGPLDVKNPKTNPVDSQLSFGARNVKYYPQEGLSVNNTNSFNNDYVILRYADVVLMRAEAAFRLGDLPTATSLLNQIRVRAFGNANFNILTPTIEVIRAERTREFMCENYARRDDIRFEVAGSAIKYWTKAKEPLKPLADPDLHTAIYPIPAKQIQLNSRLSQNPGY
ncbi:MAG: RagB/SusD family nutrient uptake outer membrane protein [Sphingobacteriales bacterium]|nr:MAG: RagB/SusD family nutrient uptake outer membrane protein [Sphingobacteriales bacterium]